VNLGPHVEPIAYTMTSGAPPTTTSPVVNGHVTLTGASRGPMTIPVGTVVDLSLEANGRYFEPPTTSTPAVLSIVSEVGDGRGGWIASFRGVSLGSSTITANHHHGGCPGPVVSSDYAVAVHVINA
jgi:hypothetical protein